MEPSEPPPPYTPSGAQTTGTTSATAPSSSSRLQVPHKTRSGIPPISRRSMEDEGRALPEGWVRQYDPQSHHQFFVDTSTSPPHSIWHHPYDDDAYMSSLPSAERQRIEGLHRVPTEADIHAESSADDHSHDEAELPPRPDKADQPKGISKLGRKMKDKLTSSTHEEREVQRRQRAEEEARAYRQHQHIRQQMVKAAETGEPQLIGTDRNGKEVYIEPPMGYGGGGLRGGLGGGLGGGFPGYARGGYGYNPYNQGPYANPNARYMRPSNPYDRPYGYGYGGGMGLPLLGGLGGGMLLGGLLF